MTGQLPAAPAAAPHRSDAGVTRLGQRDIYGLVELQAIAAAAPLPVGNGASRTGLAIGYVVGGGIMIVGGLVEIVFGIDAEGKPLEQIAAPLTVVDGG